MSILMPEDISLANENFSSEDPREILLLVLRIGKMMLENGAEVYRVDETVKRIAAAYGIHSARAFVLSSAIFVTAGDEKEPQFAEVWSVPVNSANLTRVTALNALSRHIEHSRCPADEIRHALDFIEAMPGYPLWTQLLAAGATACAFSYKLSGSIGDGLAGAIVGVLFHLYRYFIGSKHLSRISSNVFGGALVAVVSIIFWRLGAVGNIDPIMIGSIMLMVPGVAFVNGIRDLAHGDYLSGTIRILDAIIVFFSIAIGVGSVIELYELTIGGL